MKRIGVDVGGTFTDLIYVDDEAGVIHVHKLPTTPDDPSQGTIQGVKELAEEAGAEPSTLDQVFHGTTIATNIVIEHNGARVGMITTEGYRDILHIARHKKPLNFSNYQDLPWQRYPVVRRRYRLHRARADHGRRLGARAARRGERARAGARAQGGRRRGRLRLLPVLLPQPGARAAGRGDRARGVPRGVPLRLVRGDPAVPRVRAVLDGRPQRVRRPEGRHVRRAAQRGARGARRPHGAPPDDLGVRRRDGRGREPPPRQPAHVRPRRRRRGRHLGGEAGGVRQRDHARRRRDVGGHRPRAGGPPADEAPAGHEGRPVPGDDPDGRRRHDRRRRRLDRVRRRRRHLPRRPALGRGGAGPGRVRPRRHRGDRDRRDGEPRLAPPRGVPRRWDVARPRRWHGLRSRTARPRRSG